MSYQVLARKWRPKTFAEMVGQGHVLQVLSNMLDHDRLHHAYLFTGTRGVGKTTLARILAKCLNCESGVSATPCGQCSACNSIDEGRFIDLIEVDAASRAKVDETRELMENVPYAPSSGRYKVYIIDEVHMFSSHSFNALLKTLEEPPPHVQFLLATTEPKKIPVTILSRCLQFGLKHLSVEQIEGQLDNILQHENIESDPASRQLIAKSADGSMRDALSLLDQAIAYGGGSLHADQIREMLGTVNSVDLYKLLEALIAARPQDLFQYTDQMAAHNPNYDLVLVELLSILQKIAIFQALDGEVATQDPMIKELAQQISKEDLQLYYQIGIAGRRDFALAPDLHSGFQMILIRMLAFKPATDKPTADKPVANKPGKPDKEVTTTAQSADTTVAGVVAVEPPKYETKPPSTDQWQSILDGMPVQGLTKEFADRCVLKEYKNDRLQLLLPSAAEYLLTDSNKQRLTDLLKKHLGAGTRVKITVAETDSESPATRRQREQKENQRATELSLKTDPHIQAMEEIFGAELDEKSIIPR